MVSLFGWRGVASQVSFHKSLGRQGWASRPASTRERTGLALRGHGAQLRRGEVLSQRRTVVLTSAWVGLEPRDIQISLWAHSPRRAGPPAPPGQIFC